MNKEQVDYWFSQYIRLSNRIQGTDKCECYTCGAVFNWKEIQCGHFVKRRHLAGRWNTFNAKPQCEECNKIHDGEERIFFDNLIDEYGDEKADEISSLRYKTVKLSKKDISEIGEFFKNEVMNML